MADCLSPHPYVRIERSDDRWQLLGVGHVIHDSLESLALEEGYRVSALCDRVKICEAYFRELFLRDVGLTPKAWMRWERMVVARRLLCWELECEEIASRLGFADCNSFRREFRKVYGAPPREFFDVRFGRWREGGGERSGDAGGKLAN